MIWFRSDGVAMRHVASPRAFIVNTKAWALAEPLSLLVRLPGPLIAEVSICAVATKVANPPEEISSARRQTRSILNLNLYSGITSGAAVLLQREYRRGLLYSVEPGDPTTLLPELPPATTGSNVVYP